MNDKVAIDSAATPGAADWKLQDKIKQAMKDANGDLEAAAKLLNTKAPLLQCKMKKWGMAQTSVPPRQRKFIRARFSP